MKGRFTLDSLLFFSCFLWSTTAFSQVSDADCNQLTVDVEVNGSCADRDTGALELRVSGGKAPYSFMWDHGSQRKKLDHLAPGNYSVLVKDAQGCTLKKTYSIERLRPLSASVELVHNRNPKKSKGAIQLHVTGGAKPYLFSWESETGSVKTGIIPDQDQQNLPPGWYRIRIFDASSCSVVVETVLH